MRFIRFQNLIQALSLLAVAGFLLSATAPVVYAQTNTTGAIAGVVSDSTGAIIPGAAVTVTGLATGATRTIATSPAGEFRVSLLPPGAYSITVVAAGFEKSIQTIDVSASSVASADVVLSVGKASLTVEVAAGEVPMLHVDDAQLQTSFTEQQIQTLPNPGNDLTFIAQTAAGSVMNTQSGYGNFSSFGLPGTANTFTVNGGYDNDPFLNTSNSGASNLLLGANDIATETVTSNAYNASFGGLGGAQVSQISRSGGNKFHGNAAYWWNGRVMNANDYFNKQTTPVTPRAFDNANQWAGAIGGPIRSDKTFFFVDYEGLAVVLPSRATIYAPDASYQAQVLANLNANGLASEIPIYQNIFNLYNKAPGYSTAVVSTPDTASDPYGTVKFNGTAGNYSHEWLINGRIDDAISENDHLFGHATVDKGMQATYTNLLNPLFDALSAQPSYSGQLGEQHTFSPAISNQFLFSAIYYVAVFSNANEAASEQIVPFTLNFSDGDLAQNSPGGFPGSATIGGYNSIWPQGRNVTGYQFQDDLSWTAGKHTLSFGWTMRRDDITDYSPSEYTTSPQVAVSNASFEQGYSDTWEENFPTRPTQPVALYAMGWYAQDQWKPVPNLTLTYGLRMEHNSNPVCRTNCFAHLNGDFAGLNASTSIAYNKLISSNLGVAMPNLQTIGWEPRAGFAYLPFGAGSKTTIRGGFGIFADAFPGIIAEDLLNNAPSNVPFTIYGPASGGSNTLLVPGATPSVPGATGSASSIAVSSDKAFASAFANGGSFDTISAAVPTFSAPSVTNPATKIKYPTYEEWSLAIEHQLNRFDSFSIMYVGNHSYHEPEVNNSVNAYNSGGATGFPELSTTAAPNSNFGAVTEISSSGNGNFNGLILSGQHRSKSLMLSVNYQWSHALDEISNGGFSPFSGNSINPDNPFNLRQNYGNADYDVRQYVSGSYVYTLPHFRGPKLLVDNWEFAGTVFHSTGLPFSVVDSGTAAMLSNYSGPLYAKQISSLKGHTHCGGTAAAQGTSCAFAADFAPDVYNAAGTAIAVQSATDFGQSRRNQIYGPNYTDTDLSVTKGFIMPHWDTAKVRVGAQFFNLFNHPNFGQPGNDVASPGSLGTITSAVNPPTSILGSFLGGDASPRLVQLTAKFDF
jgi:hypothetical protein